ASLPVRPQDRGPRSTLDDRRAPSIGNADNLFPRERSAFGRRPARGAVRGIHGSTPCKNATTGLPHPPFSMASGRADLSTRHGERWFFCRCHAPGRSTKYNCSLMVVRSLLNLHGSTRLTDRI